MAACFSAIGCRPCFPRAVARLGVLRQPISPALPLPFSLPFARSLLPCGAHLPGSRQLLTLYAPSTPSALPSLASSPPLPSAPAPLASFSSSSSSSQSFPPHVYMMLAAVPLAMAAFSLDRRRRMTASLVAQQEDDLARERRRHVRGYRLPLDPELAAQISKGSFLGFATGLIVSIFSRTLVFLLGVAFTLQILAAHVGIDLKTYLQLEERLKASKVLSALAEDTAFKLSFSITFALAAFAQF